MNNLIRAFAACALLLGELSSPAFAGAGSPPASVVVLGQCNIPIIFAGNGSIGNNGALSGLTSLQNTYPSAYFYLPANAIAAGVVAGAYYGVGSSNTAATLYNNTYSSGTCSVPASPTAFATTGPGAYTRSDTSTDTNLYSLVIPANTMQANDSLCIYYSGSFTNNANAKSIKIKFASTTLRAPTVTSVATLNDPGVCLINRGSQTAQLTAPATTTASIAGTSGGTTVLYSIDFTAQQTLLVTLNIGTATDNVILEHIMVVRYVGQ